MERTKVSERSVMLGGAKVAFPLKMGSQLVSSYITRGLFTFKLPQKVFLFASRGSRAGFLWKKNAESPAPRLHPTLSAG